MALSEHEKKVLDELGQQFNAEDPKFARSMGSGLAQEPRTRGMFLGVLTALAGIGLFWPVSVWRSFPWGWQGFLS